MEPSGCDPLGAVRFGSADTIDLSPLFAAIHGKEKLIAVQVLTFKSINLVEVFEFSEMLYHQGVIFDEGKDLGRNILGLKKVVRDAVDEKGAPCSSHERYRDP